MLRRSFTVLMSSKVSRTIIRDPRKAKSKRIKSSRAVVAAKDQDDSNNLQVQNPTDHQGRMPLPFEPSQQNQQSLGLGSYMIAGVGVAMGVTLVGAIFGAIG
mmetsp:Transcript_43254/g.73776  ORF Transcript_43254/g.73776 Transcript_43254/m.73776 type:complete len:102 (+) Transcript_43254:159-464(+)